MPRGRRVTRPAPEFTPLWLRQGQRQPATTPPEIPILAQMYNRGATQQAATLPTISPRTTQASARANVPAPPQIHTPPSGLFAPQPQGQAAQGAEGQPSFARYFGRWGYAMPHVLNPEQVAADQAQQARQYTPPTSPAERVGATVAAAAAGGGGGGGAQYAPAPAGVDAGWYQQFQKEHGGQTPEQFYGQTGEGLPHALADKEWSEGFAQMYGRPPNEYDWRAHWFSTRAGGTPESREKARSNYSRWVDKQRDKERQEQKPPTYMPPAVIWR
jgi:hypothetical protein